MKAWRNVTLNLGLVSIPMGVVPGVRQEKIHFVTVHKKCMEQVNQSWYCSTCDVHIRNGDEEIVKAIPGYSSNIEVTPDEIASTKTPYDAAVKLTKFVPRDEVGSMVIEGSYWLMPGKLDRQNAYGALWEAMERKQVVAVGKSAISENEHIVCVMPVQGGLAMFNLAAPSEMVKPDWEMLPANDAMVSMGETLIEEFSGELQEVDFVRDDLERKKDLVAFKTIGQPVPKVEKEEIPAPSDFILAIKESIKAEQAAKKKRGKAAVKR